MIGGPAADNGWLMEAQEGVQLWVNGVAAGSTVKVELWFSDAPTAATAAETLVAEEVATETEKIDVFISLPSPSPLFVFVQIHVDGEPADGWAPRRLINMSQSYRLSEEARQKGAICWAKRLKSGPWVRPVLPSIEAKHAALAEIMRIPGVECVAHGGSLSRPVTVALHPCADKLAVALSMLERLTPFELVFSTGRQSIEMD